MKNSQSNCTWDDFPVGTRVKIICDYQDFSFWYGETGVVTENKGYGKGVTDKGFGVCYLGINVKFDKPRHFIDGYIETDFNFNPTDLEPLKDNDPLSNEELESSKVFVTAEQINKIKQLKEKIKEIIDLSNEIKLDNLLE